MLPPSYCVSQGIGSVLGITIIQNTWDETLLVTGSSEEDLPSLEIFRVVLRPQSTVGLAWSCLSSIQRSKIPGLPGQVASRQSVAPICALAVQSGSLCGRGSRLGAYQVRNGQTQGPPAATLSE